MNSALILRLGGVFAVVAAIMTNAADATTIRGPRGQTYKIDHKIAALHMRASAYVDMGDLERAMQDANECIRLNPGFFGGYQTRGRVYRRRGELDKAIREYDKALKLDPNFPYLYVNRGVAYYGKGDGQRAMADFNEAIRRNPKEGDAYGNRGIFYYERGQFDKALAEYNKALALNPGGDNFYNRALLFNKIGKLDAALRDYNEAVRRNPTNGDGYYGRGNAHEARGAYRQAAADWQKAAQLSPKDPRVLNALAWLKATCPDGSLRNGKEAVRLALKLCQISNWKDSDYLDTLAAAYAEEGNFEKAVEHQRRALKLDTAKSSKREGKQSRLRLYQERRPFHEAVSSL